MHSGSRHSCVWASRSGSIEVVHLNAWGPTWGGEPRGSRCADTQPLRGRTRPSHGILHSDAYSDVLAAAMCMTADMCSRNEVDAAKIA
jgi:hypothetical protein